MTLKSDTKFEGKLTCGLENDMRNLGKHRWLKRYFKSYHYHFCPLLRPDRNNKRHFGISVNVVQTNLMRFIFVHFQ